MEMPIDQEDFDNEIFETLTSPKSQDKKRYCPQCNNIFVGRANKKFCTSNCRKRHSEPKRNSQESRTKWRENAEFFDRALRLAEMFHQKLNKDIDIIDVTYGSHKKYVWQCLKNPNHSWLRSAKSMCDDRAKASCPHCRKEMPSK